MGLLFVNTQNGWLPSDLVPNTSCVNSYTAVSALSASVTTLKCEAQIYFHLLQKCHNPALGTCGQTAAACGGEE